MAIPQLDTETLLLLTIIGVVVAVFLGLHTEWRMSRLLCGKSGKSLEETIVRNSSDIERFKQFREKLESYLETVEKRLKQSTRGVETVRFSPFKGTGDGGNMSFATAFLDENGDGVVFSTIQTRERTSVFGKPLKGGKSEYELTGEERQVIEAARKRLNNQ